MRASTAQCLFSPSLAGTSALSRVPTTSTRTVVHSKTLGDGLEVPRLGTEVVQSGKGALQRLHRHIDDALYGHVADVV
jgi:hypothetical protein